MNIDIADEVTTATKAAVTVVEVQNPTSEELATLVAELNTNENFAAKGVEFKFKKSIDKDTKHETVRKPVVLAVPYLNVNGLISVIQAGGKGLELLLEAAEGVINAAVRDCLADDYKLNAATFDAAKVSWETIANQPKAQRKGGGIPKETWEAFIVDYIAVMPAATGKTLEQVTNMTKILANRLASVKTNEAVLNVVVEQLTVYLSATTNAEDFAECVETLLSKADQFLNMSDEDLLAAL